MVELANIVKKFAEQVAVEAGLGVVRIFLNDKIKDVTPNDMCNAIQTNQDIWDVTPKDVRGGGSGFKQQYGKYLEKYQNEVNVENVLKWIQKDRPELFSTILNTPNGVTYLGNQVEKLKYKILREL